MQSDIYSTTDEHTDDDYPLPLPYEGFTGNRAAFWRVEAWGSDAVSTVSKARFALSEGRLPQAYTVECLIGSIAHAYDLLHEQNAFTRRLSAHEQVRSAVQETISRELNRMTADG